MSLHPLAVFVMACFLCFPTLIRADECGCGNWTYDYDYILDSVKLTQSRNILCCVTGIPRDSEVTVDWTFNGKNLSDFMTSVTEKRCNDKVLLIKSASKNHEGNYTCTIKNKDGTTGSLTTSLNVYSPEGFLQKPTGAWIKPEIAVYAFEGDSTNFSCQAIVGNPGSGLPPTVFWLYVPPNGSEDFLPDGVQEYIEHKDDTITGIIKIRNITKEHFGTYICQVQNSFGSVYKNATLIHGLSPQDKKTQDLKLAVIVALVIIGVALWLIYCSWRCRWTLEICFREKFRTSADPGFLYDVFIVHGEMASSWVREVLLPTLELTYGYLCFVPDRDMLGGQQYADAISQAMSKCRRVLVVITPCLLQSQWAKWAVHNGINTCLTSQTRILAVVLQELGNKIVTSETTGLLKTLQMIKKIGVPRSCGLKTIGENPRDPDGEMMNVSNKSDKDLKNDVRLSVPEFMFGNHGSHSPKNQRVSNMITGSNNVSREKLDEREDLHCPDENAKRQSVVYDDVSGFEDPGTPCSVTPFILPSSKKVTISDDDREACGSVLNCMNHACCGDQEIIFWQKVRVYLEPPGVRQRRITAETIA